MKSNRYGCTALAVVVFALLIDLNAFTPVLYAQAKKTAEGPRLHREIPDSVKVERDIVYAKYGKREVKLDLYLPKKPASEKIPCIVVITGGGWTSGDKTRFAAVASHLADQGFAAACIDYRLLPEVKFPAPVMDCKAAVRWVRANAAKHGIDPDRIGTMGGSAGGHLAAMLGTSHNEPKLEGDGGNPGVSSRVQAVVGMATPTDMTRFAERTKLNKEMVALVSPVTHVSKESAPLLLLHGTKDGTVPMQQSELLLEKYKKAGVSAELVKIPDGVHAFWNFEQWFDDTMNRSVEFFGTQLGKGKTSTEPRSKPDPATPAKNPQEGKTADPEPPVCYDITKTFPREVGHYRVTRAAKPVEPFEIMDGLYYVGNTQVGAHLLKSTDGLILFDSTMPHEVPWLLESIRKLGFKPSDVKVVVGNHSHVDHIGGHWYFQKHFGAQTWLQVEDASGTEAGIWKPGKLVELDGTIDTLGRAFPPFKTDRHLRDGEVVEWGGRKMTFRRAPGHTPGTLMIEFPLQDKDGKTYRAGMLGGMGPGRPEFTATCKKLREVHVDVWLGAHPDQNKTLEKAAKLKDGKGPNPFIDPDGWMQFLDKAIGREKKAKSQRVLSSF